MSCANTFRSGKTRARGEKPRIPLLSKLSVRKTKLPNDVRLDCLAFNVPYAREPIPFFMVFLPNDLRLCFSAMHLCRLHTLRCLLIWEGIYVGDSISVKLNF